MTRGTRESVWPVKICFSFGQKSQLAQQSDLLVLMLRLSHPFARYPKLPPRESRPSKLSYYCHCNITPQAENTTNNNLFQKCQKAWILLKKPELHQLEEKRRREQEMRKSIDMHEARHTLLQVGLDRYLNIMRDQSTSSKCFHQKNLVPSLQSSTYELLFLSTTLLKMHAQCLLCNVTCAKKLPRGVYSESRANETPFSTLFQKHLKFAFALTSMLNC